MAESSILAQISQAVNANVSWQERVPTFLRHGIHLAVMVEPFLSLMFEGRKTMESRFSKNRIAPFEKIKTGDLVFLKASSGPIVGVFTAGKVEFIDLDTTKLHYLRKEYSESLAVDDSFWMAQEAKRYVTLIEVTNLKRLPRIKVEKRNMLGWMKLA